MRLLLSVLMCLAFSCASQSSNPNSLPPVVNAPVIAQHVNWLSPQEGVKSLGAKHIFIYIHEDYCGYCDLEDKVLDDPEIVAELNAHYTAIKTGTPFPRVQFLPTMIWIMPDGKELFRVEHYVDKEHLLLALKEIAKHKSRDE